MSTRPTLSFWQIWNMCFGFLGIQMGFALQNANVTRIFQTLGADPSELSLYWMAAPLTGLIVQPIIGYMSDRTWTRFGRRRPYFFIGAVLSSIALFFMPNSPALWIAIGMLWIMDASINIAMEPFRAYVGDNLPNKQRALGFVVQSFFIGVGSVIASALPWMMANWFDIANTAPEGVIPESVKYSFYIGGAVLFVAVMWTVLSTKEYSPEEIAAFEKAEHTPGSEGEDAQYASEQKFSRQGFLWLWVSTLATAAIFTLGDGNSDWNKLYILSVGGIVYSIFLYIADYLRKKSITDNGFYHIIYDLNHLPSTMLQLAAVQFFSWFALFCMWIYTTPAVTSYHYGATDTTGKIYNEGADWVGILFGAYNLFAALAAFLIPLLAARFSMQIAHFICLLCGALGYFSMYIIKDPQMLIISEIGIGIAWASILSMPYAMLSTTIPTKKMGVFMGIFNFFIVIPQLLAGATLGLILTYVFDGESIYMMLVASLFMVISALLALRVKI